MQHWKGAKTKLRAQAAVVQGADFAGAETANRQHRVLDAKTRNKQLAGVFVLIVADAVIATIFTLIAPADPRLELAYVSRKQLRTMHRVVDSFGTSASSSQSAMARPVTGEGCGSDGEKIRTSSALGT